MKASELLVSGLNISEDGYEYKGVFNLSLGNKNLNIDLSELENIIMLQEIKTVFDLDESLTEIRNVIMDIVIRKAAESSHINEGEGYQEDKKAAKSAGSLDMAGVKIFLCMGTG